MTVKELISELQKHDPSLEVRIEGCDCTGLVNGVKILQGSLTDEREPKCTCGYSRLSTPSASARHQYYCLWWEWWEPQQSELLITRPDGEENPDPKPWD